MWGGSTVESVNFMAYFFHMMLRAVVLGLRGGLRTRDLSRNGAAAPVRVGVPIYFGGAPAVVSVFLMLCFLLRKNCRGWTISTLPQRGWQDGGVGRKMAEFELHGSKRASMLHLRCLATS